jgi:hypothetical protein
MLFIVIWFDHNLAFAIVADSFERTSFHGFLAKRPPPAAWSVA